MPELFLALICPPTNCNSLPLMFVVFEIFKVSLDKSPNIELALELLLSAGTGSPIKLVIASARFMVASIELFCVMFKDWINL